MPAVCIEKMQAAGFLYSDGDDAFFYSFLKDR